MQSKRFLVICLAASALGFAAPAFAQTSGGAAAGSSMSQSSNTDSAPQGAEDNGSAAGASMGTAATQHGNGPDMRPGKSDNPAGTPETATHPQ